MKKNNEDNFFVKAIKDLIIALLAALLTAFITNHFTEGEIIDAITTRFDFVDKEMSYEQALEVIYQEREKDKNEIEKYKNEIESLNKKIEEQEDLINQQNSTEEINVIIQNATQYWNETDYTQCLTLLKNSKSRSSDIEALYKKYSDEYVLLLLSEADSLVSQREYNDAIDLLKNGKVLVLNDKIINDKIDDITSNQPVKLSELKITASRFFSQNKDKPLIDTVGNKYSENSFITYAEGDSKYGYATFYLGKKYTSLNGIIAVSDESENRDDIQLKGWIEIGTKGNDTDFNSLWSSPILSRTTSQIEIPEINIQNSEWLEIRYYNDENYFNLAGGYHSLRTIVSNVTLYND